MMHAKVALFDDRVAVVGTSNLDRQSLEHSYEVNLVLEGGDVAARVREMFALDLGVSRAVDQGALGRRGALERLVDWLASLLLWVV
jgi:phosphatidylserine/phosphatidylglycerophosphate/cardiolipin synthase-like enzyme